MEQGDDPLLYTSLSPLAPFFPVGVKVWQSTSDPTLLQTRHAS